MKSDVRLTTAHYLTSGEGRFSGILPQSNLLSDLDLESLWSVLRCFQGKSTHNICEILMKVWHYKIFSCTHVFL